jgi:hypothetical protein
MYRGDVEIVHVYTFYMFKINQRILNTLPATGSTIELLVACNISSYTPNKNTYFSPSSLIFSEWFVVQRIST